MKAKHRPLPVIASSLDPVAGPSATDGDGESEISRHGVPCDDVPEDSVLGDLRTVKPAPTTVTGRNVRNRHGRLSGSTGIGWRGSAIGWPGAGGSRNVTLS